jgi:PIN domain
MFSAGVVADANVLLSAVIGKAAARVFFDEWIAIHVTEFNAREVEEYLPSMAGKYGIAAELASNATGAAFSSGPATGGRTPAA